VTAKRSLAEIRIPFNQPFLTGRELEYIAEAHANHHLSGDGPFTRRCSAWLERTVGCPKALLTHSCTAALDMAAILADIGPGDEVIMPSFTFVSTANAFVLRGGVPVFVDVREDTLNIDESKIEAAITPKTRAIVVVHYAGVACEMDEIQAIASRHGLLVIEDAAQAVLASYKGRPLGGLGALGALSFHETKNILCGEGGALLVNDPALAERAEVIREKGTNRSRFSRGEVDKYTWVDIGSSFLPGEVVAAFLWAQMEMAEAITRRRKQIWARYQEAFAGLEASGHARRPVVPANTVSNAHNYCLLLPDLETRDRLIRGLREDGIHAVFHYVPLHDSPAGRKFGRASGSMEITRSVAERLVRLPLWLGLEAHQDEVIESCKRALAR
jgi:dTDP-4-amino-4,6-dideoxygalactose transaminase